MTLPQLARSPVRAERRPPKSLSVVREPSEPELVDWSSWYLTDEDDMGQTPQQDEIIRVAREVVGARVAELAWPEAFIGVDAFFAWVEAEPLVRVSPDVYVLASCPTPPPSSFQLWRPGLSPPLFALEVVSDDWRKDYDQGPQKYAQLGARELLVYDPDAVARPRGDRVPLQVFRRAADGQFQRVQVGASGVWLDTLGVWAVVVPTPFAPLLRLAYDAAGAELVPTPAERAARERDAAARERDAAARERDAAARERDAERDARIALETRLAALEAELAARR